MTTLKQIKDHLSLHPVYWLWCFIFILSLALQATDLTNTWRFDRIKILHGDYWLALSGHLVHISWSHWTINMVGLAVVAILFSKYCGIKQWIAVTIFSALAIATGLLWLKPELMYYAGLSGVIHGLFVYGVLSEIRTNPKSGYILLVLFITKLIWENFSGALPGSEALTGSHVITEAHLFGAVGGTLTWVLITTYKYADR